jgi:predicted HicB family RNase H-like nuclease
MRTVAQMTVHMPVDLAAWVEAEAKRRGVSVAQVVREALEQARKRAEGER